MAKLFLQDAAAYEDFSEDIALYVMLMMAKGEAKWLLAYFLAPEGETFQLKERFKPVYYALLKHLDHPDFLRMGNELSQTVEEILAKVQQMSVDYA